MTINTKGVFVGNDLQSEQAGKRTNSGSREPKRLDTDLCGHGLKQCKYKSRMVQLLYARCSFLLLINYQRPLASRFS